MDELTASLILDHMLMCQRIAQKYAHRNARHPDEAVAEAYFGLVIFFTADRRLWNNRPEKRVLGVYIKRWLIKYFERPEQCGPQKTEKLGRTQPTRETINLNMDEEMIDFLSTLTSDETAWTVFSWMRGDSTLTLDDIELLDPQFIKTVKKLRLQVSGRITRLSELKKAGVKTSREVIYESPDDLGSESGEAGYAAA